MEQKNCEQFIDGASTHDHAKQCQGQLLCTLTHTPAQTFSAEHRSPSDLKEVMPMLGISVPHATEASEKIAM